MWNRLNELFIFADEGNIEKRITSFNGGLFHEDLYGQPLSVEFVDRLREERRFDSMDALREQLKQDAIQAEQAIKKSSR